MKLIPAKYENGVIIPLKKIKKPKKVWLYLEEEKKTKKIDLSSLVGVIKKDYSNEYKDYLANKYS